jgi:7-carboxy-7-deazaguanine synthase
VRFFFLFFGTWFCTFAVRKRKMATSQTPFLYPVMEQFYTLQGEGHHVGKPSYFIRLAGCDVGCVWCDVKESWNTEGYPVHTADQLAQEASDSGTEIVVVTGGEPCMHPLKELTEALQAKGLKTHLETSGVHPLTGTWDWICFSPKKFGAPKADIFEQANEFKPIVFHHSDLKWAAQLAEKINADCLKFLQPEWSKRDEVMPIILNYLRGNPSWRLSLQTHKFIGIP